MTTAGTTTNITDLVILATKANTSDKDVWSKTGRIFLDSIDCSIEHQKAKDTRKAFTSSMDNGADTDNTDLFPKIGLNRKGEEFQLRKKSGKIKWSSWEVTARIMQNAADIAKGIEVLGITTVYPAGVLIPRTRLMELIKDATKGPGETPIETFNRCIDLASKKLDEIDSSDYPVCQSRIEELSAEFSKLLSAGI